MPKKRVRMNKRGQVSPTQSSAQTTSQLSQPIKQPTKPITMAASDHSEKFFMFSVIAYMIAFVFTILMIFVTTNLRLVSLGLIILGIILVIITIFKEEKPWDTLLGLIAILLFNLSFLIPGAIYTFWTALVLSIAALVMSIMAVREHVPKKWHVLTLVTTALLLLLQIYFAYLIFTGRIIAQ